MKHFTFLFFVLVIALRSFAQDTTKIYLLNQYKQKVKEAAVIIGDRHYTSDKEGIVTITNVVGIDSISIMHAGYKSKNFSYKDAIVKRELILQKEFSWTDLLTPMFYILAGGIWLLLFIIFAETGLFIGFFFPGDSLLFVAGILSTPLVESISLNTGSDFFNLLIISGLCSLAGILGNTVGYMTGRKVGPAMFSWRDRFLFKKKYLFQAKEFYERRGGGAIILARFVPFIRTFAPIVAGIVLMDRKKFGFFNIVGCIAWVVSMLFIGHYLNTFTKKQFNFDLEKHLEVIVIGIVLVTTAPVIIKLVFGKTKSEPTHNS